MSNDKDDISTPGSGGDYEDFLTEVTGGGDNLNNESLRKEEESPIDELKSIVLSIDWEITDQNMHAFGLEIKNLKAKWGNDKVLLNFLKILGALGEYIRAAKDLSHPDSIKILHSVFNNLEKVVMTPGIPGEEKKSIIFIEFAKYNALKDELRQIKASAVSENAENRSIEMSPDGSAGTINIQESEDAPLGSTVLGVAVEDEDDEDGDVYTDIELIPGVDGVIDDLSRETSTEHDSIIQESEDAPLGSTDMGTAVEDEDDEDGDVYTDIELIPGVDGVIDDLSRETSTDHDSIIQESEDAPLGSTDMGVAVEDEADEDGDVYTDIELTPGVDGVIDDLSRETSIEHDSIIQDTEDSPLESTVLGVAVEDEADEDGDVYTDIELTPGVDGVIDDLSRETSTDHDSIIQESEDAPLGSTDMGVAVEDEADEDGDVYTDIELTPGVDGVIDDLSQETSTEYDSIVAKSPSDNERHDGQVIAPVLPLQGEDGVGVEKEFNAERVDDVSFAAVDQRLDDFFVEDEEVASAPIDEEVALVDSDAEDVVILAVDQEVDEDGGDGTEIELQSTEDDSASDIDQSLDDFFVEDEEVASAPIEEVVALVDSDAEDVVILAVDQEVDEDGGDGTEIELQSTEDDSASDFDQSLDDFFVEDEEVASAPIEEVVALVDSDAEDVVILAVDQEVDEDGGDGTEIELQSTEDDLASDIDQSLDDFFVEDEEVASAPIDEEVALVDSDAEDVVILAVDQEVDEDGGDGTEIELQSTEDDSASDFDQSLDDFFVEDEEVASAPIEEVVALVDSDADDVVVLAVDQEVDEDGGDGTEIELQSTEDDSASDFDQSLDDFFVEDEEVASAPIEEVVALVDSDADDVVVLAVDQEVDEDGGDGTEIELQSTEDDSASDFDQSLDDFFVEDEEVASAPIDEEVALVDSDAEDVVILAVDQEVDEDGGDGTEIELQSTEDDSASDFDQSLDDFFNEDEAPVSVSLEEVVSLDGAEADVLVMMTVEDEVGDDDETDSVLELHHAVEEPSSATDQHLEESFSYGGDFPEDEKLEPHTEHILPVEPLKSVILSINRQLSEQSLEDFSDELIRLKAHWESEKVLLIFLHLIDSLGDHLKEMGAHMQPNTTQLLLSIYGKLEKAASTKSNDIIRHGILLEAIKLYIKWNEKNIGAVLLPEQREAEPVPDMILLGPAEEMSILEPID